MIGESKSFYLMRLKSIIVGGIMVSVIEKNFEYFQNMNFHEYKEGDWIAIYKNQVISKGKNLKEVMEKAKKIAPVSKTLVTKIRKTAAYL